LELILGNHVTHSKYLDLLQKAGNQLKILPHKVILKGLSQEIRVNIGKPCHTHSKYLDLLQKAGNQLKILPHKVIIKGLSQEIRVNIGKPCHTPRNQGGQPVQDLLLSGNNKDSLVIL
jgi:hypothetical protein